ncbi:hypothetical protein E3P89_02350 [Wallemia ichthyophaga]|uniref:Magnesium-dependent phosphatase P8B7.31 n=1 Tax=Wallemia ichthyophaga TaxID=245174 RepID=A0A4T0I1X8_WALIC|nr:hypothetical protein E3P90_03743 [Wallemia ichthyophaga]TIB12220.1 hypothetical protein E3P93_02375 [Wallemia ichthyophaga]TIB21927.1 hypothetical protein E3P89_02350 [Wallemia ichthyophaga]TIB23622.1 hypothetical protein E3P88_02441 [Wallemia ichthyophaga]
MFKLLTTLKYTPSESERVADGVYLWESHMYRLREGVDALSPFSASDLRESDVTNELAHSIGLANGLNQSHRVSVTLDPSTLEVSATATELKSMPDYPVNVVIDKEPTRSYSKVLPYKSNNRRIYLQSKLRNGVSYSTVRDSTFDVLMHNKNGYVTETTIANIFYKFNNDDTWYTPPVEDGLLPGLMRSHLLDIDFCSEHNQGSLIPCTPTPMMEAPANLPKLIVFDLDYTLWDLWIDTHISGPIKPSSNYNEVIPRRGSPFGFYRDVPEMLQRLKSEGIEIAAASRTAAPDYAYDALKHLKLKNRSGGDNISAKSLFDYTEVYPGSKVKHFQKLAKKSGFAYEDMLFFDDESRNKEVESLGVTFQLVGVSGTDENTLQKGVKAWRQRRGIS